MPYPGRAPNNEWVADGIAFSSRYSIRCPKSLHYILEAIDKDIYKKENFELGTSGFDLSYLAQQGVLLLNCGLTLPSNAKKSGEHIPLWEPFIDYILKKIYEHKDGISFILMGADARRYADVLNKHDTFQVLQCEHPSRANYRGGKWYHENVFRACDGFQKSINGITIRW